jgi:hypothetical protein
MAYEVRAAVVLYTLMMIKEHAWRARERRMPPLRFSSLYLRPHAAAQRAFVTPAALCWIRRDSASSGAALQCRC